ncbi:histone-like protein 18C isoform X2 [Drosophila kikkawai]|uniref:Histone-like protein 18C isoform X2 n=1 Tax=Drosophila kikkawai TaxID=30033 RepID=A0A6P4J4S1_DROKI|nr:histone-like protein 18C isoform X2 [Drosophila kikkawai]
MYKFISAKVQNIFRSVFYVYNQANIMSTQNISSPGGSVFDWSLVAKDSATLDIGFSNFLNDYKLVCDEHLTYEEILDKAKCRWAEMTQEQRMQFFPDDLKQSVSPNLIAGDRLVEGNATETPTISDTSTCGCYDTGFANYADLVTMRLTVLLADKWEEMSQSERAAYAGKDNHNGAANDYERGHDPRISQMMIEMFGHECDHKNMKMKSQKANPKCAKPVKKCSQKRRKPKPRCSKPKPKCSRPKPRCAKPKPRCAKPKPRFAPLCR